MSSDCSVKHLTNRNCCNTRNSEHFLSQFCTVTAGRPVTSLWNPSRDEERREKVRSGIEWVTIGGEEGKDNGRSESVANNSIHSVKFYNKENNDKHQHA